ncbi:MAG TPA: beta-ketoacyl-[acyl-carrier-protein] synthase family protein [Planctomycetota bacterium]|nr:beta-ketoacyl-[acyl-carrier-protein] synthase family protein [Planctomycetota bacterium]
MRRRTVITGLGVISPFGVGTDVFREGLFAGTSAVRPVTRFELGDFPLRVAAEIPDFKARDFIPREHRKAIKVMSHDVQLGVASAMLAVEDSGVLAEGKRVDPTRLGTSFGCGFMASDVNEMGAAFAASVVDGRFDARKFGVEAMKSFFPLWLLKYLPNMPACHVSIFCDTQGPNNTITSGDAASTQAVGEARRVIERGAADVMVCGGVDAKVNPVSFVRYALLCSMTTVDGAPGTLSKPFEKSRAGAVLGEGSVGLILEEYEHARTRGAKIYAEIKGYGLGCDAWRVDEIHPGGRGFVVAMRNALKTSGLSPDGVDVVFAAAKGSVSDDAAEARAIGTVFGQGDDAPPVTSTKSMIGYVSAATGILDVAAAVVALERQTIPPTINYDEPDPECPVNVVANASREAKLNHILINSGGFGGQFSSLVVAQFEPGADT